MKFRTKYKESDSLTEIVKEPETQTNPKLQKIKPLKRTAVDLEDSSVLDLSVYKTGPYSGLKPLVFVYIRPVGENIDRLLIRGEEKISYIFRGITSIDLKKRFEEALVGLRYDNYTELKKEVFQYKYNITQKQVVYDSAEHLNKTLYN